METEATFTDAPQEWTDEKKEDSIEPSDLTEVLCSWEDPTTVTQPETVAEAAVEIIASAEVDLKCKNFEGEVELSLPIEENGKEVDDHTVVVSEEVEALDESAREKSTTKLDLTEEGETPAVSGEGPISSSEAEEDVEEEPVLSEACVYESEKEDCDITSWITHSTVPYLPPESGEPVLPYFFN